MDQLVERALAARVAVQPRAPEDLQRDQLRLLRELLHHEAAERLGLRRPADLPPHPLGFAIDAGDRPFVLHPLDASDGHAGQLRHLRQAVPRLPQYLNRVTLQHVQHPSPRRFPRRVWTPTGLRRGGQNFRNGCGQNFRNQHRLSRALVSCIRLFDDALRIPSPVLDQADFSTRVDSCSDGLRPLVGSVDHTGNPHLPQEDRHTLYHPSSAWRKSPWQRGHCHAATPTPAAHHNGSPSRSTHGAAFIPPAVAAGQYLSASPAPTTTPTPTRTNTRHRRRYGCPSEGVLICCRAVKMDAPLHTRTSSFAALAHRKELRIDVAYLRLFLLLLRSANTLVSDKNIR